MARRATGNADGPAPTAKPIPVFRRVQLYSTAVPQTIVHPRNFSCVPYPQATHKVPCYEDRRELEYPIDKFSKFHRLPIVIEAGLKLFASPNLREPHNLRGPSLAKARRTQLAERMLHQFCIILCLFAVTLKGPSTARAQSAAAPVTIKVVVVAMFEAGEDTGDRPGEFQHWVERLPLPELIPNPHGYRDLRYNPDKQVLGMVTGIGTARAAASVMALGMDSRFDLTRAYWLVAGISGVDPADMSLGSAAWAEWLVDGDIAHQIDIREAPDDWTTGYVPLRKSTPYELPLREDDEGAVYRLNTGLVNWAYNLTRDMELPDTEDLKVIRARYINYPTAQKPPFILKGDHLAAMTFWHGAMLTKWANDWVAYWTGGEGNFVTSAMEDTGTHQSLNFLHNAGRVDKNRYLVLRSASNYSMPHEGLTAAQSLAGEKKDKGYSAYFPALDNAFRAGSKVVNALIDGWEDYEANIPQAE